MVACDDMEAAISRSVTFLMPPNHIADTPIRSATALHLELLKPWKGMDGFEENLESLDE